VVGPCGIRPGRQLNSPWYSHAHNYCGKCGKYNWSYYVTWDTSSCVWQAKVTGWWSNWVIRHINLDADVDDVAYRQRENVYLDQRCDTNGYFELRVSTYRWVDWRYTYEVGFWYIKYHRTLYFDGRDDMTFVGVTYGYIYAL
jgi:hypothetical protein